MRRGRRRLFEAVADAWLDLFHFDQRADAADGSPHPAVTATARILGESLSFVRVALAHASVPDQFEAVLSMAREQEEFGWKSHRERCATCGGH